jgi:GT2 family glycosyltransferase
MSSIEQSNGFLPLEALRHAESTAVGLWDLDDVSAITYTLHDADQNAGDQLVLARLHNQPLAFLYLPQAPGTESRENLLAAVWRDARADILEHVRSYGCLPLPAGVEDLDAMLHADAGHCPGAIPARPAGSAAVIVCTTGGSALERSLNSLTQMNCEDFAVIVVDNRPSRPETRALIESLASPIPLKYVPEPRPGLAIARNTGLAAAADVAFVAFTDDDVVVDSQWLSWLLSQFTQTEIAAVTGLVMPLTLGSQVQKRFEQYAGFGKGLRAERYDLTEHRAGERFLYPYWGGMFGSGNSMAFRRDTLLAIGGFDPALGAGTLTAGGEDLAAFTDVILGGGQLAYEPRSLCWHEHRADEEALRTQINNYGIGLTAVLWRYFTTDWRFSLTVLRSLPLIARLARSRSDDRQVDRLPTDLARLELRGRLLGPLRYVASRRRVQAGAAGRSSGERRPEADQPGDQTRT